MLFAMRLTLCLVSAALVIDIADMKRTGAPAIFCGTAVSHPDLGRRQSHHRCVVLCTAFSKHNFLVALRAAARLDEQASYASRPARPAYRFLRAGTERDPIPNSGEVFINGRKIGLSPRDPVRLGGGTPYERWSSPADPVDVA